LPDQEDKRWFVLALTGEIVEGIEILDGLQTTAAVTSDDIGALQHN
jgi:hypothetical protein